MFLKFCDDRILLLFRISTDQIIHRDAHAVIEAEADYCPRTQIIFQHPQAGPVLSALSKSAIRSFTSSIPTEMRTRSSVRPRASRTSAGMLAWDMKHGMLIRDFTLPVDKATCMSNFHSKRV